MPRPNADRRTPVAGRRQAVGGQNISFTPSCICRASKVDVMVP
jgi:hypothetical protein